VVVSSELQHLTPNILSDTTTRVTPASDQCVRSANYIPVEEAGRPYLARDERASQNANEESDSVETCSIVRCACERRRNRANEEAANESETGSVSIAKRPRDGTHDESCGEGDDVRVGDFILGKMKVLFDADT
jgi:hypothetical protein